ncbi:hypothetical protein V6N11_049430 [Hibiscus sabdariffa]|uniref:Uncharacterized protein n=1 Tax=Hibiscus sabdariffa TaxID=183260 RepID=A0ABR2NAL8_9ROSI
MEGSSSAQEESNKAQKVFEMVHGTHQGFNRRSREKLYESCDPLPKWVVAPHVKNNVIGTMWDIDLLRDLMTMENWITLLVVSS